MQLVVVWIHEGEGSRWTALGGKINSFKQFRAPIAITKTFAQCILNS